MAKNKINTKINFDAKNFDPFGAKPVGKAVGKAIDQATVTSFKALEGFLSVTCKPLLEELGFLFRDKIFSYRLRNILAVLEKAQGKLQYDGEKLTIHPRIAYSIVEQASLVDNDDIQQMWAGLFASSCNHESDDRNIIFIDTLKRLTGSQVKFLNYLCEKVSKSINLEKLDEHRKAGFIKTDIPLISIQEICQISQISDLQMVSLEVGVLENLELISILRTYPKMAALFEQSDSIRVKPSAFLLQLYVRCQGSNDNPLNYFHPVIFNGFMSKTNKLFDIQESKFLDFLSEKYALQKPHGILLLVKGSVRGDSFIKVDSTFLEVSQSEATDILVAYAICNWQDFDFALKYQIKVRTSQNNSVVDTEIGSFSVNLGFEKLVNMD